MFLVATALASVMHAPHAHAFEEQQQAVPFLYPPLSPPPDIRQCNGEDFAPDIVQMGIRDLREKLELHRAELADIRKDLAGTPSLTSSSRSQLAQHEAYLSNLVEHETEALREKEAHLFHCDVATGRLL